MTDENSPIFDYYPINFQTDLNGKKNEWEAVVLIPFIDEVSDEYIQFRISILRNSIFLIFYYRNDYLKLWNHVTTV